MPHVGTVLSSVLHPESGRSESAVQASPAVGTPENVIMASLAVLRSHLDMEVAFVGRVQDGRRVFDFVDTESPDCPVQPGLSDPLEDTYCGRIVSGSIPQLIHDAQTEPGVADLAVTRQLPVGSHMSVPLSRSSGEVMGTLCCFSHHSDDSLRERDLQLLTMFAEVVSTQLEILVDDDRERADKEARILAVLERGGPRIALQPIVHTEDRHVRGFEALSRFPGNGWTPQQWFAEARMLGRGVELEASAITCALATLPRLPPEATLAVNASADALLSDTVLKALTGEHAGRLVVELTEHARIEDYDLLTDSLTALRASGARIAVDDAGSGWAGLEHILRLQPEVLKLDRALITGVDDHTGRQAMLEAMVGFANRMGAVLVAEGVETQAELACLRSLGVPYAQGYLLGSPKVAY